MPYVTVPEHLAETVCCCVRPSVLIWDRPGGGTGHGHDCTRCGGALTPDDVALIEADLRKTEGEQT